MNLDTLDICRYTYATVGVCILWEGVPTPDTVERRRVFD